MPFVSLFPGISNANRPRRFGSIITYEPARAIECRIVAHSDRAFFVLHTAQTLSSQRALVRLSAKTATARLQGNDRIELVEIPFCRLVRPWQNELASE